MGPSSKNQTFNAWMQFFSFGSKKNDDEKQLHIVDTSPQAGTQNSKDTSEIE